MIEEERFLDSIRINDNSKLAQLFESMYLFFPLSVTDREGKILNVNKAFEDGLGYSLSELKGNTHSMIKHPDSTNEDFKDLWETISSKNRYFGLLKNLHKNGTTIWYTTIIKPILDENEEIKYYFCFRIDISSQISDQRNINIIENYSEYGTLKKYSKFKEELQSRNNGLLLIIGIANFTEISSIFGYEFARKLLEEFSSRINIALPDYKSYSFDELNLFASYLEGDVSITDRLKDFVAQTRDELLRPFELSGEKFEIDINIGVAEGENITLEQKARLAYSNASDRNMDIVYFEEKMNTNLKMIKNNKALINEIRCSIDEDRIKVYYQPIYNYEKKCIDKYECLVRMINKSGEVLSPFSFLEIAKTSKVYLQITRIVIDAAFKQFENRKESFSINITYDDIKNKVNRDYIFKKIDEFRDKQRIVFEILEDQDTMKYFDDVTEFIKEIRNKGCKIAIDDFGIGFSNIDNILSFDIDLIKIDGTLIKKIKENSTKCVLEGIINFAKAKNIKLVAEFIEDQEIENEVKKLGIEWGQGYYIGKPSPDLNQE